MFRIITKKIVLIGGSLVLVICLFFLAAISSYEGVINSVVAAASNDNPDFEGIEDLEPEEKCIATYVGVDDTPTEFSKKIEESVRLFKGKNPYYNGYASLCELWCYDVYRRAGAEYNGSCCAYKHSTLAIKEGEIKRGALIFSGQRPDGTFYENGRRESAKCKVCGHYAGHVGIYIGGGKVAGSQVPFIYSIDSWIASYGYGGYSLS